MALVDFLGRPIAYHRIYREITGNTVAAILLSQAVYWQGKVDSGKGGVAGWWWKSRAEWEGELGLSRSEQETARRILRKKNILKEVRRGVPAKVWYRVNLKVLEEKLQEYQHNAVIQHSGGADFDHPGSDETTNKMAGDQPDNNSESTPKITSEINPSNSLDNDRREEEYEFSNVRAI